MAGTILALDFLVPKLGMVIDNKDPLNLGRIKVRVPGVFDTNNVKLLPWISRGWSHNANQFSGLLYGDKIHLILNPNNELSFTYQPSPEPSPQVRELLQDSSGADLLMFRTGQDGNPRTIFANDSEGINFNNAGSTFNIDPFGVINLSNPTGVGMNIDSGNSILIGDPVETEEPAVLGKKLTELLDNLSKNLDKIAEAAEKNPYTQHLAFPIKIAKMDLDNDISKILSSTVKITI